MGSWTMCRCSVCPGASQHHQASQGWQPRATQFCGLFGVDTECGKAGMAFTMVMGREWAQKDARRVVYIPNSRGYTEVRQSVSPIRGATPKHGSLYPQFEGLHRSVGVHFFPQTRGATLKLGSLYLLLAGTHRSVNAPPQTASRSHISAFAHTSMIHV